MKRKYKRLETPRRILLGPGPSNVPEEVSRAMSLPILGHLDPAFLSIMEEVQEMLRAVFMTKNRLTLPVSGTGSAGMEAAFVNIVEPGDSVLVCVNGVFGLRMCDIVERLGGVLHKVEADWGKPIDIQQVRDELGRCDARVVAVVHAETSTGVLQPLEELSDIVHEKGALFIVDTVTSLSGAPLKIDTWNIDVCYSGTQKCLSCPPGLAPITFNDRALDKIARRSTPVRSWYLDMTMVQKYWGADRVYHHTAPINMIYALREALRLILEEGLEARWERHLKNHLALVEGLEELGLQLLVEKPYRIPMLNSVLVPEGVDEAIVRKRLLEEFSIEVGAGLGPLKGKILRIGIMGHSSTKENIEKLLSALKTILS